MYVLESGMCISGDIHKKPNSKFSEEKKRDKIGRQNYFSLFCIRFLKALAIYYF